MKRYLVCLTLVLCVLASRPVLALQKTINDLQLLPINYGINNLTLGKQDIIITRAELPSEAAGSGDIYSILYKQDAKWNLVQYNNHKFNIASWPHTGEDAISSVRFFTTKNMDEIYMLKASRDLGKSAPEPSVATFELYKIQKNDDFGYIEFQLIETVTTQKKYCNIEDALNKELGIALPEDYAACN